MKKLLINFKDWCNSNQGLLTFFALIVTVLTLIPYNRIGLGSGNSFFQSTFSILSYTVVIPMYVLILAALIILLYTLTIIRRFRRRAITFKFLIGRWKNEWNGENFNGTQIIQITKNGDYILDGRPTFKIKDFEFDPSKSQIKFSKVGLLPTDDRILINTLKIINNDLLDGTEDHYNIRYTRL